MRQITKDFLNGTSTEKLSIISNLSTVLGISIATLVAGPFLNRFANIEFIVSDFIISVLFYFLCVWLSGYVLYSNMLSAYKTYQLNQKKQTTKTAFLLVFYIWGGTVLFPIAKDTFAFVFSNTYLLPQTANDAVLSVEKYSTETVDEILTIKGVFKYAPFTEGSNYRVVVYSKSKSALYSPVQTANYNYSNQLTTSGSFTIPINVKYNPVHNAVIVVYRGLDRTFAGLLNSSNEYPDRFAQFDSVKLNKMGAFVFEPKT